MTVAAEHPEYQKYASKWKRCRDVSEGQDAVHLAGEAYLPKLKSQEQVDYEAYKKRTPFYNATWRTISGMLGMMFRKPPQVEVPPSVEPLLPAVTSGGQQFDNFASEIAEECLEVGRVGILVDFPVVNANGVTQADALAMNLRPFLAKYETESIINWKTALVRNMRALSQVVLKETHSESKDEFENKDEVRYRVLDLLNGVYRVRLFKIDETTKLDVLISEVFPVMGGKSMDFIPFYVISTDDTEICPDDPPLIDLVDLNLAHYRTAADYEHGCHFTALPTGYIAGHTLDDGEKIYLGSQTMLVFPDPDAKVGFLEFTGSGLDALEKNLERKEGQMAVLGARMLEAQKRAAEAAETAAIHRAGENSLLASIATTISMGLQKALTTFTEWAGADASEVSVQLNRDFFPMPMDSASLTALVSSWQTGAISKETLFDNLKQGQVIADSVDFETEEMRIMNQLQP